MEVLLQGETRHRRRHITIKSNKMPRETFRAKYSLINRLALVVSFASMGLAGCDDGATPRQDSTPAPKVEGFSIAGRAWLDIKDEISPSVWLASREAGRDVAPNDPAAASFRGLLEEADVRFSEGPRMIANRAVQVEAMLAERGVKESPRQVIEGLVSIGQHGERAGFGETCQHYVNARTSGVSRVAALDALRRQPLPQATGADDK
jgi:hypothetical protein